MNLSNPKPWFNDGAVNYYESIMSKGMKILEFGGGSSTLWLEKFEPKLLVSLESDESWFNDLSSHTTMTDLRFQPDYPHDLDNEWESHSFDLIVIDGINRLKCLYWVIEHKLLAENGTIIYDDMHRRWLPHEKGPDYQDAWDALELEGFEMILIPATPAHELTIPYQRTTAHDMTLFSHKVK